MKLRERLTPAFAGALRLGHLRENYLEHLAERVRRGLLAQAPASRNRYRIENRGDDRLRFAAATLWTAVNLGLNRVEVLADEREGLIRYRVSYWTWARYVLALSLGLVLLLGLLFSLPLLGVAFPDSVAMPGPRELLLFGLPLAIFWGLVWPWILIAIHKGPAERYLQHILEEVNRGEARRSG